MGIRRLLYSGFFFKTRLSLKKKASFETCFSGGVLQRLDRMDGDKGDKTIVRTRKKLSIIKRIEWRYGEEN